MLKDNITKSKKKQINGYRFFYKKKFFFSHSNSNLCFVLMANIISAGRVVYHSGFFTCSFGHT